LIRFAALLGLDKQKRLEGDLMVVVVVVVVVVVFLKRKQ